MSITLSKFSSAIALLSTACLMAAHQAPAVMAAETPPEPATIVVENVSPPSLESPEHFAQRYLDAVASARSPLQLLPYRKPRKDMPSMPAATSEEDKKMEAKMISALLEMQRISTPSKAKVTGSQDRDGKILLQLQATQVDPLAKLNLNESGAAATGKMLLEKGPAGWLIVDEYWHYVYPNGLTTDTGHDPDAAPKVATPIDKYTDQVMSALDQIWPEPAQGTGQVTIEIRNSSSGQFQVLGVKDKHGSEEAEGRVKAAIAKIKLPPLPDEVAEQPIVNIQLSWSPHSKDTLKLVQLLHDPILVK